MKRITHNLICCFISLLAVAQSHLPPPSAWPDFSKVMTPEQLKEFRKFNEQNEKQFHKEFAQDLNNHRKFQNSLIDQAVQEQLLYSWVDIGIVIMVLVLAAGGFYRGKRKATRRKLEFAFPGNRAKIVTVSLLGAITIGVCCWAFISDPNRIAGPVVAGMAVICWLPILQNTVIYLVKRSRKAKIPAEPGMIFPSRVVVPMDFASIAGAATFIVLAIVIIVANRFDFFGYFK
ncbi:MAG TPA: hypothetical protein VGG19_15560 [Tepidisphaeraceae bacterium]|jgi:hypothetical protein